MQKTKWLAALVAVLMMASVVIAPILSVSAAAGLYVGTDYVIVSKNSGMAMTVEGNSADNDALIVQMPVGNYASQVWTLQDGGDGYYKLVNKHSGKSMNVPWASTEAGVQPVQWNSGNADNEKWDITETGDGYYRITPKLAPAMGLNVSGASVASGGAVIQWNYAGADNEKWSFVQVNQVQPNPQAELPDPAYVIDTYIDAFFYFEDGVGKLKNEPSNGFWTDAEIMEVFIDAYERLGDPKYLTVAEQFYDGFIDRRGTEWSGNGFNDDILWMALATVRLYLNTGKAEHLAVAKQNFDMCYNRAWDTSVLNGGLWWTTDKLTKNGCVNGPGALAALKLYEATGDRAYYDKGKQIVDWMIAELYVADTGELYDNIHRNGTITHWINTGNQGNLVGACAMLYQHTGDQKYLNVAKKAADLSATLGDGSKELLNEGANSADSIGGKGLLARWLGYYVRELNVRDYDQFILDNAASAWSYRNSADLMWGEFGRQTVENIQTGDSTLAGSTTLKRDYAAWGCSAAVSWILNFYDGEPAGKNEMENGTFAGGAASVDAAGCSNGKYVGNVGGGNPGTVSFNVNSKNAGIATLYVYYATAEARNLGVSVNGTTYTVNCPSTGDWGTVGAPVELAVNVRAGGNTIQFTGTNGDYAPNLDYFIIDTPFAGSANAIGVLGANEMENGMLAGGAASVDAAGCSNGKYVGNVGGGNPGTVTYLIPATAASAATIQVYYATAEARNLGIVVNGTTYTVNCPSTGSWGTPGNPVAVNVNLKAGYNTMQFTGVNGGYAPNLDRFTVAGGSSNAVNASAWTLTSPDGGTALRVQRADNGSLSYTVTQDGATIVENSQLGMVTSIGDFTNGLNFQSEENRTINETYTMLSGKSNVNTNHCNEKTLTFVKNGVRFGVIVRAYNDGVAFRYTITANGQNMTVNPGGEKTTIKLPGNAQIWYMPRNDVNFMYEDRYLTSTVNALANGTQASVPTIYKTGNKFALIAEADHHGTYVGSLLKHEGNGVMRTIFDLAQTSAVSTATPFTSPWRTVIIGSANDIMQNTMVENLSPAPNASYDFASWVKPGMSSWSWVSYYGGQEDPEIHKEFIDLAADMGWEYYILDEGWQPQSNTAGSRYEGMRSWFTEIRDYANSKGVKLFVWVDKLDVDTAAEREARFREWSAAGIVGIKVDFFYNESQATLKLHDDIYADAAKYKLMVNVHGSNPPSGELRTYPNIIAREAIFGQEQGGITAEQYTLIPFIRAAVGTADVTEQLYSRDTSKTTMGFQIALSTLIENGLHSMGSKPDEYYSIPAAVSYYTNFPTKWDDLYVIGADIGEQVHLARKTGDVWYAAGVSVNARTFRYNPTFLDPNKTYTAIVYKEEPYQRQDLEMVVHNNVTVNSTISVDVDYGGGYAVKFVPNGGNLQSITATPANVTLATYATQTVKLGYNPANTNSTDVTWSVGDSSIAKITTTASGVTIKGLKPGTTTVTATSMYDNNKRAVINVTVTAGAYSFNDADWDILNSTDSYVINGTNSATITAQNGVVDKDVFAMPISGDFEVTAKLSGGLNARYQGGYIGVFTRDLGTFASVGRRYHDSFNTGGTYAYNHISTMSNSVEQYVRDSDRDRDVYVRLVKQGNNFTGYYRYSANDAWTQVNTLTNAALAASQMYVGFYAGCGGSTNGIDITFSEITLNGNPVKLATANAAGTGANVKEMENGTFAGGAAVVNAAACSNGKYVGNIGGPNGGSVTYTVSGTAGKATLNIYYATAQARDLAVIVNGNTYTVNCPGTGDWGTPGNPVQVEVTLNNGNNTIRFTGANGAYAPNLDCFTVEQGGAYSFEAEQGVLAGGAASVDAAACSNGKYVGNVGGGNGTVTFTVGAGAAGNYTMRVYYATAEARDLAVIVNGNTYTVNCPSTGDWGTPGNPVELTVSLNSGNNTIVLAGVNGAYAPNLDRIELDLSAYSIEVETATLSGGAAVVNAAACSNGQYVGNVGGANGASATLNVNVPTGGQRTLRVYYATAQARDLAVIVNGNTYTVNCPGTGDWGTPGNPVEITVNLNSGNNTIVLTGVNGAYAPNLDRIEL